MGQQCLIGTIFHTIRHIIRHIIRWVIVPTGTVCCPDPQLYIEMSKNMSDIFISSWGIKICHPLWTIYWIGYYIICQVSSYHHEGLKSATPLNYISEWVITCQISSYHHEGLKSATPLNYILKWVITCQISSYHHEGLKAATPSEIYLYIQR